METSPFKNSLLTKALFGVLFIFGVLLHSGGSPLFSASSAPPAPATDDESLSGTILIVGNGPERYLLELLAAEFERQHPSVSVDFFWHSDAKPIRTLELNEADIAITGETSSKFRSTVIARDGIAVLTNFSNPVTEMSSHQVAEVFSGKLRYWSQVYEEAPQMKIVLVNRTKNQNIRQGLEKSLNIQRAIPRTAKRVEKEGDAIKAVSGNLNAITFLSMAPALRAKEDGIAVNLLFIDKIEPEVQTVLDKRYPLQRPVVLVTAPDPSPQVLAFERFVLSRAGQRLMKKGKYYPLEEN